MRCHCVYRGSGSIARWEEKGNSECNLGYITLKLDLRSLSEFVVVGARSPIYKWNECGHPPSQSSPRRSRDRQRRPGGGERLSRRRLTASLAASEVRRL